MRQDHSIPLKDLEQWVRLLDGSGVNNPSSCPSPSGRRDDVARSERSFQSCTVAATSPLPEGEGQDEGRFAQFDAPSSDCGIGGHFALHFPLKKMN